LVVGNSNSKNLIDMIRSSNSWTNKNWSSEIQTSKKKHNNYTQEEIGEKIGWSRSKVCDYSNLLNNIDAQVLDIARKHQKDRASKIDAHATFNFTAGC